MASRSHDKSYLVCYYAFSLIFLKPDSFMQNRRYLLEKDFSWKDLKKNHLESSITSSDEVPFLELFYWLFTNIALTFRARLKNIHLTACIRQIKMITRDIRPNCAGLLKKLENANTQTNANSLMDPMNYEA